MISAYLDTSALAKWYLREPGSAAFEEFILDVPDALISRLTQVEMRCLLARRMRSGSIDAGTERSAYQLFVRDIHAGHLTVLGLTDRCWGEAINLVDRLSGHGLRALDALHLAVAYDAAVDLFATADLALAEATRRLGLETGTFG